MTRARDIAGGTVFTGADNTKLDGIATGATAYVHPTGAGNQHVPAAGAAGQLLQYASAGTAAWATISSGESITFPSDWSSPTTTYTSSGTWSKGSLADDAYVWLYLVGGGGGGSMRENTNGTGASEGGNGGGAFFIYGQAGLLNGTAYVIGAAQAGRSVAGGGTRYNAVTGNSSTFTLPSSIGGLVFTTASSTKTDSASYVKVIGTGGAVDVIGGSGSFGDFTLKVTPNSFVASDLGLPSGVTGVFGLGKRSYALSGGGQHAIFAAGNGGSNYDNSVSNGTSQFAGAGGVNATQGANGASPGGGGGASQNGSNNGGAGAAGNLRQYNV